MKIYLVGGAVRDKLLNRPVKEKDWVVVGATVEEMLQLGYKQVGKDFPVFLHPTTKEEYALARVERKVGKGYTGFTFDTSKSVTLEEDLKRRDITINAIAEDQKTQEIIDRYHGREDLKNKIIRHVSDAFIEDPVRILRVARFAARFPDFTIAPETIELMQKMVSNGEVDALVAERVWKECEKALVETHPQRFFEVLERCDALSVLFPIFAANIKCIDNLAQAARTSENPIIRCAVLFHLLPENEILKISNQYKIPNDYRDLAILVAKNFQKYTSEDELKSENILNLLESTDAFRRKDRFENFLMACEICDSNFPAKLLNQCYEASKNVDANKYIARGVQGEKIGLAIREERKNIIKQLMQRPRMGTA